MSLEFQVDGKYGDVVWGVLGCPLVLGFFCAVTSAEYVGNQDNNISKERGRMCIAVGC